jgi:GTP cyclohydrolase I
MTVTKDQAEQAVGVLLAYIGENPEREGLLDTPKRVAKALREMTSGLFVIPEDVLGTVFAEHSDSPVIVRDIRFSSLCEHHLLPFSGKALVAYQPLGKVIGLSKLPRLVEVFARRPQLQERMTNQIAKSLFQFLAPAATGVIIKAHHSCMGCRGVNQPDAEMITSSFTGSWADNYQIQESLSKHV